MLRAFAEDADRAYKKFTKKKMLNKFVTVASELVSIAGLALAPATAGASLPLTVFGQSVSAVAAVGGIVTELREVSRNKNLCDRVNSRVPNRDQQFEDAFGERIPYFTAAGQVVYKCGRAWEVINKRVLALLPTKSLSYTVRKILPSSAQPLAKVAPVYGGPIAFVSLGEDVYSLWDNWRKLKNEAKAELAEELRDRAKELEEELILNTKCYDTLKKKKELRENQLTRSSLKETKKTEPQPPSGNGKAGSQGTGKMKAWASEMS
ncbi:apolipoprotein L6-like [Erethizon dorsatum]